MIRRFSAAILLAATATAHGQDAISELKQRADAGDVKAMHQIAAAYYAGAGVDQNYKEAVRWLEKLAASGDKDERSYGRTTLGLMYLKGEGVEQDFNRAFAYFGRAAIENDAAAQYNLGNMYFQGKGTPRDYAKAAEWYQKASRFGHVQAQHDLGMLYYQGVGVPKDLPHAYMWVQIAALQGDERSERTLKLVGTDMSPGQIAEAKELARDWMNRMKKQFR